MGEKTRRLKLCEMEVNKWLCFKQLLCFSLRESDATKKDGKLYIFVSFLGGGLVFGFGFDFFFL